ncbi:hypothetical protein HMPREF1584_00145 [Gardnerella vaginalis JCP8481A]|nr:hypothetical protein HMPREF1585_01217 [Gardnerella vaginalis JCP8481B]EPI44845.1 hypothetical protein HMPREF1584_00145 [Gardnerella vaginalis JCP8481A]
MKRLDFAMFKTLHIRFQLLCFMTPFGGHGGMEELHPIVWLPPRYVVGRGSFCH